jgi:hypothetical protein
LPPRGMYETQMRRSVVVCLLLTLLVSSCTGAEPVPSPTPATQATSVAAPVACRAVRTGNTTASSFVAIAERQGGGVALFLDASTGAVQGRIDNVGSLPEAALDPNASQFALLCQATHELVVYDMATLVERWRVLFEDPQQAKAVGGTLALAFSQRGDFVYAMHNKALQPDATAVGGSRYWMSVHDARSGGRVAEIELTECGLGRLLGDGQGVTYVLCKEGLRAVDVTTWKVVATAPVDPGLRPVLLRDSRVIGVTADLRVKVFDARTGKAEETKWSDSGRSVLSHFGRLAVSADGTRVVVMTRLAGNPNEWAPDTATEIDLAAGKRTDFPMADVRGTGYVGGRRIYFEQGRMRSADGTLDVSLLTGPVTYWTLLGKP